MAYDPPEKDEIRECITAGWLAFLQEMDTSEGSPEYHFADSVAQGTIGSMGQSKSLNRDMDPLNAVGQKLITLASLYGLTQEPATGAEDGTISVYVTGSGSWTTALTATSPDGETYQADSGGSWSSDGTADIAMSATSTGAATTKALGARITMDSPPGGMNPAGWVAVAFETPGRDLETVEELRQRFLLLLSGSGNSGNRGDYVRWMTEVALIQQAYVFGQMRHNLSIDGTIFGASTTPGQRWLAAAQVTAVENAVNGTGGQEGERAVGQDFDCVLPTAEDQAVDVTIDSDADYGRDWGVAATTECSIKTSGIDSTNLNEVTVDEDPEDATRDMAVGDRVAINIFVDTGYYHLEVRTVTAIEDLGGSEWLITVGEPFSSSLYSGDMIPAGPTTEATVTAIEAAFDALGPADDAGATRWPLVSSEYPCDLTIPELNRRVMDVAVEGVRRHLDVTWTTPSADVVATPSSISGTLLANTIRLTTMAVRFNVRNGS